MKISSTTREFSAEVNHHALRVAYNAGQLPFRQYLPASNAGPLRDVLNFSCGFSCHLYSASLHQHLPFTPVIVVAMFVPYKGRITIGVIFHSISLAFLAFFLFVASQTVLILFLRGFAGAAQGIHLE